MSGSSKWLISIDDIWSWGGYTFTSYPALKYGVKCFGTEPKFQFMWVRLEHILWAKLRAQRSWQQLKVDQFKLGFKTLLRITAFTSVVNSTWFCSPRVMFWDTGKYSVFFLIWILCIVRVRDAFKYYASSPELTVELERTTALFLFRGKNA